MSYGLAVIVEIVSEYEENVWHLRSFALLRRNRLLEDVTKTDITSPRTLRISPSLSEAVH